MESTIAAFKDRTIHTYHTEGAGGGHAPDIIKVSQREAEVSVMQNVVLRGFAARVPC